MTDRREFDHHYVKDLLDSEMWFEAAGELMFAASRLERGVQTFWRAIRSELREGHRDPRPPQVVGVYLMLTGYAIENLCKAQLVRGLTARERAEVQRTKKLPTRLKSHRLVGLLEGIGLNDFDPYLVAQIEAAAVWYGRYPVPASSADFGETATVGGQRVGTYLIHEMHHRHARALVARVRLHVGFIMPIRRQPARRRGTPTNGENEDATRRS
jgi:hypothetical protein